MLQHFLYFGAKQYSIYITIIVLCTYIAVEEAEIPGVGHHPWSRP